MVFVFVLDLERERERESESERGSESEREREREREVVLFSLSRAHARKFFQKKNVFYLLRRLEVLLDAGVDLSGRGGGEILVGGLLLLFFLSVEGEERTR